LLLARLLKLPPLFLPPNRPDLGDFTAAWIYEQISGIDLHLAVSLIGILATASLKKSPVLPAVPGLARLVLMMLVATGVCAYGTNYLEAALMVSWREAGLAIGGYSTLPMAPVLFWFEPVLLSLGVVGPYYLFRYVEAKAKA
jgi:hypothetical protein